MLIWRCVPNQEIFQIKKRPQFGRPPIFPAYLLIFGFAEPMFDPFCGMGLYKKIALVLGLSNKDEEITKVEEDNISILNNFENQSVKIDNYWKLLFKLE